MEILAESNIFTTWLKIFWQSRFHELLVRRWYVRPVRALIGANSSTSALRVLRTFKLLEDQIRRPRLRFKCSWRFGHLPYWWLLRTLGSDEALLLRNTIYRTDLRHHAHHVHNHLHPPHLLPPNDHYWDEDVRHGCDALDWADKHWLYGFDFHLSVYVRAAFYSTCVDQHAFMSLVSLLKVGARASWLVSNAAARLVRCHLRLSSWYSDTCNQRNSTHSTSTIKEPVWFTRGPLSNCSKHNYLQRPAHFPTAGTEPKRWVWCTSVSKHSFEPRLVRNWFLTWKDAFELHLN